MCSFMQQMLLTEVMATIPWQALSCSIVPIDEHPQLERHEVALDMDMPKDFIVDHRLPKQSMLPAQVDAGMTLDRLSRCHMTISHPHRTKRATMGRQLPYLPWHRTAAKSQLTLLTVASDRVHAGTMSPAAPVYSPSLLNEYSPTSPYVPQSPFAGATLPFSTLPYVTSPFAIVAALLHHQHAP
jgi:DNA-directed RNA polymerase II subunit RPB1